VAECGLAVCMLGVRAACPVMLHARSCVLSFLASSNLQDLETAWEAVRHAKLPRVHTFIATSGGWAASQLGQGVGRAGRWARGHEGRVQPSPQICSECRQWQCRHSAPHRWSNAEPSVKHCFARCARCACCACCAEIHMKYKLRMTPDQVGGFVGAGPAEGSGWAPQQSTCLHGP